MKVSWMQRKTKAPENIKPEWTQESRASWICGKRGTRNEEGEEDQEQGGWTLSNTYKDPLLTSRDRMSENERN